VIVIDDGIATGKTLFATVALLKKSRPAKIVIAVPVISTSAFEQLEKEVDEVVALIIPESFTGVGAFYVDFTQVTDEEVLDSLHRLQALKKTG
jgi:predicted phosphoribosyltransferase